MNTIGASVWGRLFGWLEHQPPDEVYARLKRTPLAQDCRHELEAFFRGGQLSPDAADIAFQRIAHRIRTSRILFVPTLLSGVAFGASRQRLVDYQTLQVRQLRDEGFDAQIADIDASGSVTANGERLADILRAHHCPTWIVTHSKGGLDALEALVGFPDARRYVEGWIAFQTPFFGSPVADVACGGMRARKISQAALRVMGANVEAICNLRTDLRGQYMDEHAVEIAQTLQDVPVMCVRSTLRSYLWPTGRWMSEQGLANDGLVPANSCVLPGSRYVTLEGLGHGEVAARHVFSGMRIEQIDLLKALFVLMFGGSVVPRRNSA